MKYIVVSFIPIVLGFIANQHLNDNRCLIQNVVLDSALSLTSNNLNCKITEVTIRLKHE